MTGFVARLCALLLIAMSLPSTAAAQIDNDVDLVFTRPFAGMGVSTDGQTVVWTEETIGPAPEYRTYDVVAVAHVGEWDRHVIRNGLGLDEPGAAKHEFAAPDVSGDIVVWVESLGVYADPDWPQEQRVVVYDLSSGQMRVLVSAGPGVNIWTPRVVGTHVAWVESTEAATRIMLRDLRGQGPAQVVAETEDPGLWGFWRGGRNLVVDRGTLYWGETSGGMGTVRSYRPDNGAAVVYQHENAVAGPGTFDVADGVLTVRIQHTDPDPYSHFVRVMVFDLDVDTGGVGLEIAVPLPAAVWMHGDGSPGARSIATNGRYVFVNHFDPLSTPGSNCCHYYVIAYDLLSDSVFTLFHDLNVSVEVSGDVLLWTQGHGLGGFWVRAGYLRSHLPSAPAPDDRAADAAWRWFLETGHYLQFGFKGFWEANGGLPVFGYPLTEEFQQMRHDTGGWRVAQFTERQRFEWHPENAGSPYEVLLGRLGAELLAAQGRDWRDFPTADPSSAHYFDVTGHAIDPRFWGYWSSHGLELGDPGASFRESLALFGHPLSEPMVETNADGDTVLTQYFERTVFEWHPDNPDPWRILLRRLGAEMVEERGW